MAIYLNNFKIQESKTQWSSGHDDACNAYEIAQATTHLQPCAKTSPKRK
ncbi:MAG: hypothetical protein ACRCXC_13495 [Legionella sp.]